MPELSPINPNQSASQAAKASEVELQDITQPEGSKVANGKQTREAASILSKAELKQASHEDQFSLLKDAIQSNDVDSLNKILKHGKLKELLRQRSNGDNVLTMAVKSGDKQMVSAVLKAAKTIGVGPMVKELILDRDDNKTNRFSAFNEAIRSGDASIIKELLLSAKSGFGTILKPILQIEGLYATLSAIGDDDLTQTVTKLAKERLSQKERVEFFDNAGTISGFHTTEIAASLNKHGISVKEHLFEVEADGLRKFDSVVAENNTAELKAYLNLAKTIDINKSIKKLLLAPDDEGVNQFTPIKEALQNRNAEAIKMLLSAAKSGLGTILKPILTDFKDANGFSFFEAIHSMQDEDLMAYVTKEANGRLSKSEQDSFFELSETYRTSRDLQLAHDDFEALTSEASLSQCFEAQDSATLARISDSLNGVSKVEPNLSEQDYYNQLDKLDRDLAAMSKKVVSYLVQNSDLSSDFSKEALGLFQTILEKVDNVTRDFEIPMLYGSGIKPARYTNLLQHFLNTGNVEASKVLLQSTALGRTPQTITLEHDVDNEELRALLQQNIIRVELAKDDDEVVQTAAEASQAAAEEMRTVEEPATPRISAAKEAEELLAAAQEAVDTGDASILDDLSSSSAAKKKVLNAHAGELMAEAASPDIVTQILELLRDKSVVDRSTKKQLRITLATKFDEEESDMTSKARIEEGIVDFLENPELKLLANDGIYAISAKHDDQNFLIQAAKKGMSHKVGKAIIAYMQHMPDSKEEVFKHYKRDMKALMQGGDNSLKEWIKSLSDFLKEQSDIRASEKVMQKFNKVFENHI